MDTVGELKGWNSTSDYSGTFYVYGPAPNDEATPVWKVDGTGNFTITSQPDLEEIDDGLTADYVLAADITVIGTWHTLGGTTPTAFTGTLDGNGHTIHFSDAVEIKAIGATDKYAGLFGLIQGTASIASVRDLIITGTLRAADSTIGANYLYMGGIAGKVTGYGTVVDVTIENCAVKAAVTLSQTGTGSAYVGGLAGYADSYAGIQNCYSTGTITTDTSSVSRVVGGICGGINDNTEISKCYATGDITVYNGTTNSRKVGGIAGENSNGCTIQDCVALNGSISVTAGGVPPLIGRVLGNGSSSSFTNNYGRDGMEGDTWVSNANDVDGADVTIAATEATGGSWWTGTANWSSVWGNEPWTWGANNRPKLWFE
jgi:hypothetical protein